MLDERTAHNEALKRCLGGAMLECLLNGKSKKDFAFSKFTNITPEACTLSGYTRQELAKLTLPDLLCDAKNGEEEKQKVNSLLNNYSEQLYKGKTVTFETPVVFKSRKTICLLILTLYKTAGENRVVIILKEIAKELYEDDVITKRDKEIIEDPDRAVITEEELANKQKMKGAR